MKRKAHTLKLHRETLRPLETLALEPAVGMVYTAPLPVQRLQHLRNLHGDLRHKLLLID